MLQLHNLLLSLQHRYAKRHTLASKDQVLAITAIHLKLLLGTDCCWVLLQACNMFLSATHMSAVCLQAGQVHFLRVQHHLLYSACAVGKLMTHSCTCQCQLQ